MVPEKSLLIARSVSLSLCRFFTYCIRIQVSSYHGVSYSLWFLQHVLYLWLLCPIESLGIYWYYSASCRYADSTNFSIGSLPAILLCQIIGCLVVAICGCVLFTDLQQNTQTNVFTMPQIYLVCSLRFVICTLMKNLFKTFF